MLYMLTDEVFTFPGDRPARFNIAHPFFNAFRNSGSDNISSVSIKIHILRRSTTLGCPSGVIR